MHTFASGSVRLQTLLPAPQLLRELAPRAHEAHAGRAARDAEARARALDVESLEVDELQQLAVIVGQELERDAQRDAALLADERAEPAARRVRLREVGGEVVRRVRRAAPADALLQEPPGSRPQVPAEPARVFEARRAVQSQEAQDGLL